jgi:hypothetical protein
METLKNKFNSYTFFPGQNWGHTLERQHELIFRFSKDIKSNIYISNPLGIIKYQIFSFKFIFKLFKRIFIPTKDNNTNHIPDNAIIINNFKNFTNFKFINHFLYKRILINMNISNNNFIWATYPNEIILKLFQISKFSIYDIAERRSNNHLLSKQIKDLEIEIVKISNIVFVDNMATYYDYINYNTNIFYIPQGVNIAEFFPLYFSEKKYIGYIGNLHSAIDYDLLNSLIDFNSNEKFLIIGNILDNKANKIIRKKNVTYIKNIPKSELNIFLSQMKIGLIPYKINEITCGVFPTKFFEYIAADLPVLTTSLPELTKYNIYDFVFYFDKPIILNSILHSITYLNINNLVNNNTWDKRWETYVGLTNKYIYESN